MTRQPFSPPSRKLPGWFYESKPAQEIITKAFVQASRERAIEFILKALELRFDPDPDQAWLLAARIAALEDLESLNRFHRAAIQVPTLAAFQDLLSEAFRSESSIGQLVVEEGFEEGSKKYAIKFLREVLDLRFDPDEVRQLTARIAGIKDVQRLKQLHRAAIQVPDLEEFRRLLEDMIVA